MSADNAVLIKVDPLSEGTFGRLGIVIITSVSATMKTVLFPEGTTLPFTDAIICVFLYNIQRYKEWILGEGGK